MTDAPIMYRYEGSGEFRTTAFWASRADKQFVVGETYKLVEHHDRSANSHRHFFATINDAHGNLPDEALDEYPTAEHLRKKALIWKGYRHTRDYVCETPAAARNMAAFVRPMDEYAVIIARDCVVRVHTAMSQSVKAMGAKEFQASKTAVLEFIDDLLGVERGETAKSEAA